GGTPTRGPLGDPNRRRPEPRGVPPPEADGAIPEVDDSSAPEPLWPLAPPSDRRARPRVVGPRRMVPARPGGTPEGPQGNASPLASRGLGPGPQARRLPRPLDPPGRRRRDRTPETVAGLPPHLGQST